MEHEVYLILGSNIEPEKNIPLAVKELKQSLNLVEASSLWRTLPIGTSGPEFLNLAVHVRTSLSAHELKERILCSIEEDLGRVRSENKFADRPIDIDIAIYDKIVMEPHLVSYDYLVLPFSELLPEFIPAENSPPLKELAKRIRPLSQAVCLGKFVLD